MTTKPSVQQSEGCTDFDANLPLTIIGFSKGCVVLNQLIYDLEEAMIKHRDFLSKIHSMYWLDGGHNGGSNTWITDASVLNSLKSSVVKDLKVLAYITPYQMRDSNRPWVGQEYLQFVQRLHRLKVNVTDKVYFPDEPRSLEKHFEILVNF